MILWAGPRQLWPGDRGISRITTLTKASRKDFMPSAVQRTLRPRACRPSTNFRSCLSPGPGLADTSAKVTKTDGDNATLSLSLNATYTLMTTPLVKQFSLSPWLFFCYLCEACVLILTVRGGTKRGQGPRHGMRFFFLHELS